MESPVTIGVQRPAVRGCASFLAPQRLIWGIIDTASLAWRSSRILCLAWYIRHLHSRAERQAETAAKAGDEDTEAAIWDALDHRISKIVCDHMLAFQGVWIKLGQFLSTRADVMSDIWVENLKTLQDAVPRERWSETSKTLQESFGSSGLAAFAHIETEPLATASIASVHRATLAWGEHGKPLAVVIKVQRRGIGAVIESDLRNLRFLVRRMAKEKSRWDYTAMVDEWSDETLRELDFVNEALNTELVGHNLAAVEGCKVPAVVRTAAVAPTPRALVLEFIDGAKLTAAAAELAPPAKLVATLSAAFAQQIFVDGVFNADPHPGNLMVERASGLLVLLDFGMTKHVTDVQRVAFARLLLAAADADYAGLLLALREMVTAARLDLDCDFY